MTPVPVPASEHAGTHGRPAARMCPGKPRGSGPESKHTEHVCRHACEGVCRSVYYVEYRNVCVGEMYFYVYLNYFSHCHDQIPGKRSLVMKG